MTFEELLITHLKTRSVITTAVSTRFYPGVAPDAVTKPYVVWFPISITSEYTHDGTAATTYTIQFSVFGSTYLSACTVRDALMTELSGFNGTITSGATSAHIVSLHSNTRHRYESDTQLHHLAIDFDITA